MIDLDPHHEGKIRGLITSEDMLELPSEVLDAVNRMATVLDERGYEAWVKLQADLARMECRPEAEKFFRILARGCSRPEIDLQYAPNSWPRHGRQFVLFGAIAATVACLALCLIG